MRLAAFALALLSVSCVPRITYVLDERVAHGWIVIEQRDTCPVARGSGGKIFYDIPASGYLCSATREPEGIGYRRYVLRSSSGTESLIDDDLIHHEKTVASGPVGGEHYPCAFEASVFFYGSPTQIRSHPTEAIFRWRPDCRPKA